MKRRAALATSAAFLLPMTSTSAAFSHLKASAPLPVMFIGHGSPMNAIEDNAYRQSWQKLGADLLSKYEKPQLILCISAHWLTRGWHLTAMEQPKTIHDFGGFPQELFAQQYPAPGAPAAAREIGHYLRPAAPPGSDMAIGLDQSWGLDHGTWSILKPMFPAANIPVMQLSMDYHRPAAEHYALGQALAKLRGRGVLIVGSGNVVHNLRMMRQGTPANQAYDWAQEFDAITADHIANGNLAALANFQKLGSLAANAHPTFEHYLPLLYAAGAVHKGEQARMFNTDFTEAAIAMRSVVWG